jgi:Fe-S-cluster containining protein
MPADPSACLTCGACCCHYRVSFYWQEAEQRGLDEKDLVQVTPWRVCFRGTERTPSRCVHLTGEVGKQAMCSIYEQRPHPCRELQVGDEKCLQARAAHGLGPLE